MRSREILLERNIGNIGEIDEYVENMSYAIRRPAGKKWFTRIFRKWLINEYGEQQGEATLSELYYDASRDIFFIKVARFLHDDATSVIERDRIHPAAAEKIKNKTEVIYYFPTNLMMNELTQHVRTMADYLNQLDQPVIRMTVPQMMAASVEYHAELAKSSDSNLTDQETDVTELHLYEDGWRWVEIISQHGLKREGNMMGHCVGDYCVDNDEETNPEETQIFSLRDPSNRPHVTIETVGREAIRQIYGRANTTPLKYRQYILDALNNRAIIGRPFYDPDIYTLDMLLGLGIISTERNYYIMPEEFNKNRFILTTSDNKTDIVSYRELTKLLDYRDIHVALDTLINGSEYEMEAPIMMMGTPTVRTIIKIYQPE